MSIRTLLIAPTLRGGEGVYRDTLLQYPPDNFEYDATGSFKQGARGASPLLIREVLLNRLVHPRVIPDMGFRALKLRDSYDLVHVHAHPVSIARRRGVPVVMSEGSSSAVYLGEYLGWSDERLAEGYARARRLYRLLGVHDRLLALDRTAGVYVFSRWAREVNIRWGADPEKLEVVYPGFPTPPEPDPAPSENFTFLFIGTDFERKGGFDVVEAFAQVVADHPVARLVIVAPDPSVPNPDRLVHAWVSQDRRDRVLAVLDDLAARGLAIVHPPLGRDELYERTYPAANAFVMPTLAEGLGFTNVEAMSFALPVLSSRVGPVEEVVADGQAGLLVTPGSVPELAVAMARLIEEPRLARRLGATGREQFLSTFTMDAFRARLGDFYARAMARR
jgi:glycosyltransferase involved in cell wall biosynthesis